MSNPPKKGTPEYEKWIKNLSESHKGIEFSPEHKANISAAKKGKKQSPEHIANHAAAMRGKPAHNRGKSPSKETGRKIGEANRKRVVTDKTRAKMSVAHTGRKFSPETCAKIGAVHKGKVVSEETRAKVSVSKKGTPSVMAGNTHTPAAREKLSKSARAQWDRMSDEEKEQKLILLQESNKRIRRLWIEDVYAKRLDKQGIVYEQQKRIGRYKVDFYIPTENRIVEINGCYWHACSQCPINFRADYEKKRQADQARYEYLRQKGYTVEIVWEHDLPRKSRHIPMPKRE